MRTNREVACAWAATFPLAPFPKFLPNIAICEPVDAWVDARIRLAGSVLTERFGRDIAGMPISELYNSDPEGRRMLPECARRAQETRLPGLFDTRVVANKIELMRFEVAALPIFAPDGLTPWCLAGIMRF